MTAQLKKEQVQVQEAQHTAAELGARCDADQERYGCAVSGFNMTLEFQPPLLLSLRALERAIEEKNSQLDSFKALEHQYIVHAARFGCRTLIVLPGPSNLKPKSRNARQKSRPFKMSRLSTLLYFHACVIRTHPISGTSLSWRQLPIRTRRSESW